MIPKVIHYCWFGNGQMTDLELDCLSSWKKICSDFDFIIWNESNFPLADFPFANEAYRLGFYAFVSDVARIFAVEKYGGIYLDTDMLVLKPFDLLLANSFFIGEHLPGQVGVGIFGAIKHHPLMVSTLNVYKALNFDPNHLVLIPDLFDDILEDFRIDKITIHPSDYFYPLPFSKKGENYSLYVTSNTIAVHLWNHSWKDEFAYLKEHKFLKAFSLFVHHLFLYPKTYLSKPFLSRFATECRVMFKQYLYFKLKENRG